MKYIQIQSAGELRITLPGTNIAGWENPPFESMYLLCKMVVSHCYVSLPEGTPLFQGFVANGLSRRVVF